MPSRTLTWLVSLALTAPLAAAPPITVRQTDDHVEVETDALVARVRKRGYVSGVAQASLLDKKTGARDVGFGLHIMDFLLAPGWRDGDDYSRDPKFHGNLPRQHIEGPQICTKAKKLEPEVIEGDGFVAVRLRHRFTEAAPGFKAGSVWEQTLVFRPGLRYFLSGEEITCANDVPELSYRIDMPGHVRHTAGDSFAQVYLSYVGKPLPAAAFAADFAPDAKYLYQRAPGKTPARMIRAYQVKVGGKPGPWLGGLTLDPDLVSEAWCHQRGYICFIQELHGRRVKAGDQIGAAYAVGWFDDVAAMEKLCDDLKGKRRLRVDGGRVLLD